MGSLLSDSTPLLPHGQDMLRIRGGRIPSTATTGSDSRTFAGVLAGGVLLRWAALLVQQRDERDHLGQPKHGTASGGTASDGAASGSAASSDAAHCMEGKAISWTAWREVQLSVARLHL